MKYYISFNNNLYLINNSIALAINKINPNLHSSIEDKIKIFILTKYDLPLFEVVPRVSLSHFYAIILGKQYRINKEFFEFLDFRSNRVTVKKRQNDKLEKFYTKLPVAELCVSTFTANVTIQWTC